MDSWALTGFLPGKGLAWDKKAEGVARLMTDVRQHWNQPLTHNLLFAWQQAVVPESYLYNINRGAYRDDEMQIVSGGVGHYKVHYEAPPPDRQACLRPRDRFWDIPVPKIDSAFDNLLVPQPSWSPSTTQQLRKLVAAPYLTPI